MEEKKPKIISAGITAAFMLVVVLVLLSFGYDPPDPPIPEEGVEVNVGDADFGSGDDPQPSSQQTGYVPPASNNNQVVTQNTESTTPMPSNPTPSRPSTQPVPQQEQPTETKPKEPEINKNALFTGRRNNGGSGQGSQGVTEGQGNQGKPNGSETSSNYSGNGGGNGTYSLAGRTNVSLPKPNYSTNQQGKIVVKIVVNQQGRVIRAEAPAQGSTIANSAMVEQARQAALKARFNADPNAPEEQSGTITYIYKI